MLTGYFCRVKKKKKQSMEDCMKNILQSLSSAIEENSGTETPKSSSIICAEQWQQDIICLVFWDTEQKEVSDPGSHTVLFSLPLFQICLFYSSLFMERFCKKAMLSCKNMVFHAVFSFLDQVLPLYGRASIVLACHRQQGNEQ